MGILIGRLEHTNLLFRQPSCRMESGAADGRGVRGVVGISQPVAHPDEDNKLV